MKSARSNAPVKGQQPADAKKKNTLAEIQKLQRDRDERRKAMDQVSVFLKSWSITSWYSSFCEGL